MFDHDFFITYDYGDDLPAELLRGLRQETEIEQLKNSEVVEFRNRVKSRVIEL